MAGCRAHYNIYAWIIAVVMCVSYLGVCGLYNPNVRNYSAHSVSLLGESRGIDAGNNDVLMVDSSAGLVIQTRNIRTGNSEESIDAVGGSCGIAVESDILCMCICRQISRDDKQPQMDTPGIYTQVRREETHLHWELNVIEITSEGEIIMAMDILAYTFGVIALAAAIKCFVDENWGEKMHRESEDITAPDAKDMTQDKKAA